MKLYQKFWVCIDCGTLFFKEPPKENLAAFRVEYEEATPFNIKEEYEKQWRGETQVKEGEK